MAENTTRTNHNVADTIIWVSEMACINGLSSCTSPWLHRGLREQKYCMQTSIHMCSHALYHPTYGLITMSMMTYRYHTCLWLSRIKVEQRVPAAFDRGTVFIRRKSWNSEARRGRDTDNSL